MLIVSQHGLHTMKNTIFRCWCWYHDVLSVVDVGDSMD